MIRRGEVRVNGSPARLGMSVVVGQDRIEVKGTEVVEREKPVVVVLNKPVGFLSTCRKGKEAGRVVTELVDLGCRLYPAGRLDRDSEGMLILTNDGDLALRLTHPRYGKEKEYELSLNRPCSSTLARDLKLGVRLSDGPAKAVKARCIGRTRLRVVLAEGRKRQLRRMCRALGFETTRLRRVRIGGLKLGSLKPGGWRLLSREEVEQELLSVGTRRQSARS